MDVFDAREWKGISHLLELGPGRASKVLWKRLAPVGAHIFECLVPVGGTVRRRSVIRVGLSCFKIPCHSQLTCTSACCLWIRCKLSATTPVLCLPACCRAPHHHRGMWIYPLKLWAATNPFFCKWPWSWCLTTGTEVTETAFTLWKSALDSSPSTKRKLIQVNQIFSPLHKLPCPQSPNITF